MLLIDAYAAYQNASLLDGSSESGEAGSRPGDISDLYIHEGERMRFRVPGGLLEFGDPVTRAQFIATFSQAVDGFEERIKSKGRIEESYDCPVVRINHDEGVGHDARGFDEVQMRVRMTIYSHSQGRALAAVVRFGDHQPPQLLDLGLESMARKLVEDLRGGILVTGTAHAGKTFTLMAMMEHVNRSANGHVVTIEDPIELVLKPQKCVVSQHQVGKDVESFHAGVLGSLRQSPIAVMVGEIRDSATAHAANRVMQSGHFLLAGLHTSDAAEATSTFSGLLEPMRRDEERAQMARRLSGVIHQVLVPSRDLRNWCVACEVINFNSNPTLRAKVAAGDFEGLKQAVQKDEPGTFQLNRSLLRLVSESRITPAAAMAASYLPEPLSKALQQQGLMGEEA